MKPISAGRVRACSILVLLTALAACAGTPTPPPELAPVPVPATQAAPAAASKASPAHGQLLDRVVAVVNDDVILKSELDKRVQDTERQIAAQNAGTTLPSPDVLQKQVLEQ